MGQTDGRTGGRIAVLINAPYRREGEILFSMIANPNTDLCFDMTTFYRAMLCIRATSHGPVSVCLSQVGVLLKRLNVGSQKQDRTIAQGL